MYGKILYYHFQRTDFCCDKNLNETAIFAKQLTLQKFQEQQRS